MFIKAQVNFIDDSIYSMLKKLNIMNALKCRTLATMILL